MAVCNATTEWKTPRCSFLRVSSAKQPSPALSHQRPGGRCSDLRRRQGQEALEGRRSRGEVEGPARVPGEPSLHLGMLVHGPCRRLAADACFAERDRWSPDHRFVEDRVARLVLGQLALDGVAEAAECLVTMPLPVATDDLTVEDIERREQRRAAVAPVVVGPLRGAGSPHMG